MSQGSCSTVVMLRRKVSTMLGWDASPVNRKPGDETAFRLSAYTMLRQRAPSQEPHVHVVPPGVCPGVKWAVISWGPMRKVSPSLTTRTFDTGGYVLSSAYCGSSEVGAPCSSAFAPAALAATRAPLKR